MATVKEPKAPFFRRLTRPFINLGRFFKDVYAELQRVVWPSHEETYAFTVVVMITIVIVALWVGVLDLVMIQVMERLGITG